MVILGYPLYFLLMMRNYVFTGVRYSWPSIHRTCMTTKNASSTQIVTIASILNHTVEGREVTLTGKIIDQESEMIERIDFGS